MRVQKNKNTPAAGRSLRVGRGVPADPRGPMERPNHCPASQRSDRVGFYGIGRGGSAGRFAPPLKALIPGYSNLSSRSGFSSILGKSSYSEASAESAPAAERSLRVGRGVPADPRGPMERPNHCPASQRSDRVGFYGIGRGGSAGRFAPPYDRAMLKGVGAGPHPVESGISE